MGGLRALRASSRSMMLSSRPPRPEAASWAIVKSLAMKCTISCVTQPAAVQDRAGVRFNCTVEHSGLQWRAGGAACEPRSGTGAGCDAGSLSTRMHAGAA